MKQRFQENRDEAVPAVTLNFSPGQIRPPLRVRKHWPRKRRKAVLFIPSESFIPSSHGDFLEAIQLVINRSFVSFPQRVVAT